MKEINEFKSNIFETIVAKGMRNAIQIFILLVSSTVINYSELLHFEISIWAIIIIYLFQFVIQIYLTNNDLLIKDKEIIIQSSMFKGIQKGKFSIDEIQEIIFKDDWSESFMNKCYTSLLRFIVLDYFLMFLIPYEYKWIEIRTNKNQKFKYYFFGINFDYYDNTNEVLFEDMFITMANKNIKVKWKSTKDLYFKKLQEGADKINRSFNK